MADFVAVLKKTIDGLGDQHAGDARKGLREGPHHRRRQAGRDQPAAAGRAGRAPEARARRGHQPRSRPPMPARPTIRSPNSRTYLPIDRKPDKPADVAVTTGAPRADRACGIRCRSEAMAGPRSGTDQSTVAVPASRAARRAVRRRRERNETTRAEFEEPEPRRNFAPLIAAVVALAVLAGGAYAVWLNKDDFQAMLGFGGSKSDQRAGVTRRLRPAPATAKKTVNDADAPRRAQKFTQRLNSDGSEVDTARPAASPRSAKARRSPRRRSRPRLPPDQPADRPATGG